MNEISASKKRNTRELALSLPVSVLIHVSIPQEEGHLQIRKEVLTRPRIRECLVLGLSFQNYEK